MVEKNLKKLKAKKRRVMNGFNTGIRDMKLKTAYRRKKRWSAEDAENINKAGGPGTAVFTDKAIQAYFRSA